MMRPTTSRRLPCLVEPTLWTLHDSLRLSLIVTARLLSVVLRRYMILVLSVGMIVRLLEARTSVIAVGVNSATTCGCRSHVHPIRLVASGVVLVSITAARIGTRATVEPTTATTAASVVTWLVVVMALTTRNSDIAQDHATQLIFKILGISCRLTHDGLFF